MFSKKAPEFLAENRSMNSREWFLEHKSDYNEYLLKPFAELAIDLSPVMAEIDDMIITEPRVDRAISRIYCDMRFSKDKLLYREEMWLSLKRDKHDYPCYPEFFFVVSPYEFFYGCGYYAVTTDVMESIREMITENDPMFVKACRAYEHQSELQMLGASYKRSRYPQYNEKLREWLDKKNIYFENKQTDINELFSEQLAEKVGDAFLKMKPVYEFFVCAQRRAREKKRV